MADQNPGIVFPINEDTSTTDRTITGGVIAQKRFMATTDAAGNVWISLTLQLTGATIYPNAFPAGTATDVGYFPFKNVATNDLNLDTLNVALHQATKGDPLQVTLTYLVPDGKIGGAGTSA